MRAHSDSVASNARYLTRNAIDTGQNVPNVDTTHTKRNAAHRRLVVLEHEIHRLDDSPNGPESVMSTLKGFVLRVGLQDTDGKLCDYQDGLTLKATLRFENGRVVEDTSATHEPPLLGGEAILDKGEAVFKLRITVLSSLCRNNKFRVQITATARPDLFVNTGPVRTITKLRRTPKDRFMNDLDFQGQTIGNKRAPAPEWDLAYLSKHLATEEVEPRTTAEIWQEISTNSAVLLDLQRQQARLFQELRSVQLAS